MVDDLFANKDDTYEVEPSDLTQTFQRLLELSLAKRLADQLHKPWKKEAELQEIIAKLVAAAQVRGLKTIRLTVTRKSGQKVTRDMEIAKISKDRSLQ